MCLVDAHAPELYFCDDLDGYGWCVRKGNYLNVGLGRRDDREFPSRVRAFTDWLRATGRLPGAATSSKWHGHAYISCRQRHDAARARHLPSSITRPLGRWLLRSPTCTRRVVLERWFLRSAANAEC